MAQPTSKPASIFRILEGAILLLAAVFFALHFAHLTADFPNHSPWMDWSKYTDEGWYGDAAIRHFLLGQWYVPGDFNPAAALPVWPFVEAFVFRFTGVSLVAARALTVAVFGAILVSSYLLLRRWQPRQPSRHTQLTFPFAAVRPLLRDTLAPAIAVLLLAVSPFCFVFARIAILEPLIVLLTLLALHAATSARAPGSRFSPIILGTLIPAMILTKTTAIFLLPAVFFLLYAATRYRLGPFLRAALPAALIAATLWSIYFFAVIRPHFLPDYRYLFSANAYTGITLTTAATVVVNTLRDGLWIGKFLYPLSVLAILVALARPSRLLRHHPLVISLLLWALGYAAFLAYHNNLQPRYYLVPAVPLTLLTAILCEPALHRFRSIFTPTHSLPARPILALFVAAALSLIVVLDGRQTLGYILHPEYTLVQAAESIAEVVKDDPNQKPLLLSISGSDISLITGLPSICDDFGTLELADRVKKYHPGWYAAWNQIDDDKMDALTPLYHPVRVAAFPAMDDPARNLLILYRLDPRIPTSRLRPRRQPIPHSLQTKLGQQPSVSQLEH